MKRKITALLLAGLVVALPTLAVEVSEAEAEEAVRGWLALREALGGMVDAQPESVARHTGKDGKGVFYVVSFEGGGYAVVSGDTELEPILAYSTKEEWIDDESRNPLLAMLNLDVAAASSGNGKVILKAAAGGFSASESAAAKRWTKLRGAANPAGGRTRLLKSTVTTVTDEQMSGGDLRVGPLLQSKWGQGDVGGAPCYNYCTPLNRIAGCVATMMAQIMYYHKWPQGEVTFGKKNRFGADRWSYGYGANSGRAQIEVESGTFGYYEVWANELLDNDGSGRRMLNGVNINGYQSTTAQAAQSRYSCDLTPWEPAFGGTYDWANMLDDPQAAYSSGELSNANRLAIGRLLRDVGVTVPIRYELGGGEGSAHATLALSLVDTFQYADAVFKSGVDADVFKRGILANLDAKLPVGVTIPGHAIVADGYGYADGVLYVHFNMGWGGGGAWYRPPVVYEDASLGGSDNKYNTINTIIYNIRPTGEEGASIVSGRVFDKNGSPVSDATVRCVDAGVTATTDAQGIYALFLRAGEHDLFVASESTVARTNLTVAATTSPYIYKDGVQSDGHEGKYVSVGNVWGVDLSLGEASETELGWVNEAAETSGRTGTWSSPVAYDAGTKRATLDGEYGFTPTTPSGGRVVTVETTVKFDGPVGDSEARDIPGNAQTAMRIGENGSFQLLSGGSSGLAWVDVSAAGLTPSPDTEYSVLFAFNYKAGNCTVSVKDAGGSYRQLLANDGSETFGLATNAARVAKVVLRGSGVFKSLVGDYSADGFCAGDVTGSDASLVLKAAHAEWLNGLGDYATVSGSVARLSAADLGKAYLCNLDVTKSGAAAAFKITGIEVGNDSVSVEVTLVRTAAVQKDGADAPINGILKFYGAATVEAFTNPALEPLGNAVLSDDDFSEGETATADIPLEPDAGAKFFKARIEER